ncbi:MAG: AraC family transcriptional regulator [Tannerellaceae bacterium]|jgi:AraC-like DNA-binding protein|nr:AraC family transcriptional regulator [Tannerellaceae bacterium]
MPNSSKHIHSKAVELIEQSTGSGSIARLREYKLRAEEISHSTDRSYNLIVFLVEGVMVVNSSEGLGRIVRQGEFFFIPISSYVSYQALSSCRFLIFSFERLESTCDLAYLRELSQLPVQVEYQFHAVAIRKPLLHFLKELAGFKQMMNDVEYQRVKCEECFYLLRSLYSQEEMLNIFYPIVGKSVDFRLFVLKNYLNVKNIHKMVELSGLKRKTFDRLFNYEFGLPPYQWVLRQKAKHIRYELSETDEQMQDIMRKYGFQIAPHFTRFCREYFDATPLEARKRLRMEKAQLQY